MLSLLDVCSTLCCLFYSDYTAAAINIKPRAPTSRRRETFYAAGSKPGTSRRSMSGSMSLDGMR